MSLLEQFKAYQLALGKLAISTNTKRAYETRLQHFLGFLGTHLDEYPDALVNANTKNHVVQAYKQHLKLTVKSSPPTVNAYLTAIDSFFSFVGLGRATADREILPKMAPHVLSPKEQKDFLDAVECCKRPRDRAIAILLFYTGIRIGECKDLNEDDVLFTERKGILKVRNGKGGAYREIPLNTACCSSLQEWLDERREKYPKASRQGFFLSNRGTRLSVDGIDHLVRRLAQDARLECVSTHTLRHTCLSNLIRDGVNVELVAQVGGHKKLETTMRYSLPAHSDIEAALNGTLKTSSSY